MDPPEVVAGTSRENEGSKKVKKKKQKDNPCGFKLRFNPKRLGEIGKQLSLAKQKIIRNGPFGDLFDIQPFKVPHDLIEFVVMNTNHTLREFNYKKKSIIFNKLMVKRIFNVPSGDRPVKLLKKSDENELRTIYKENNRAPIAHVIKLLKECSDEDAVMINRTWALIALAIVVCPGTGNMVNLEYLASLEDMSSVHEFAWDEHLLARAMEEVAVFQEKKRIQAAAKDAVEFQIRSCLPMLAIIYMDFLDVPAGLPNADHVIDYSVPRIRFLCQKDFNWLVKVYKNKLTLVQPFYGKHTQFRSVSNTPYAEQLVGHEAGVEAASGQGSQIQGAQNQAKDSQSNEAQANVEVEPNLSSSLNEWLQQSFPSMQDLRVPAQFQTLYEKHKGIFTAEVDDAVCKFGQGLKGLQCNRMAALLRDVGDAITATNEPTISFAAPSMEEVQQKESDAQAANTGSDAQAEAEAATPIMNNDQSNGELQKDQGVATKAAETREEQRVSSDLHGNVSPHSPPLFYDAPRSATAGIWDDEPSCELFPKGSEDYELMHGMDEPTTKKSTSNPIFENIPVFPVSDNDDSSTPTMVVANEPIVDVSSGPSTHDKNNRKKRMAKVGAVKNTKAKKQKVDEDKAADMYEKYVKHGKALRKRLPNDPQPPPFVKIGGFYIPYKKFLVCFKPRGDMNDEVMSPCIEMSNLASMVASKRAVKKYVFSVHMAVVLKRNPSTFQPNDVMSEILRAIERYKIQKYDLLFFTIVHEHHWVVICGNLLHKQWNVFDAIPAKGKASPLKKQANNLITNFTTLAQECDAFDVDIASFTYVDLEDYPKQNNLYDCGFFGLKYVHNYDGKTMKEFGQQDMPWFRIDLAYNLCTHQMNNAPMEYAFRKELAE